jgi:aspartyl/asparaginyl-tRNA synthetase
MQRVSSEQVAACVGQRVRIVGWLQQLRKLGGISFVIVRDGAGTVQAVADHARLAALAAVHPESVIAAVPRHRMQLLDLPNIRLAVLFPRDLTRLSP